uniref:Uncharacterized protein n=1 Tax=Phlebotomus papatasi TaxID=29031 RepID=A0A1B0DQ72_PHLPP
MTCSGSAVSDNTILSSGYCVMGRGNVEVLVRPEGITLNDSGNIYFANRIVFTPNEDPTTMSNGYVLLTVDRDLYGGEGFKAPDLADDDMTVASGDICTTARRSASYSAYYYWPEFEYYNVKIIDDAQCEELFMEQYTDDFICVGAIDPTAQFPDNQCQTETGAPLVCADKLFAIATC